MIYSIIFPIFVCSVSSARHSTADKEKNEGYDEFLHIYRISSLLLHEARKEGFGRIHKVYPCTRLQGQATSDMDLDISS